MRTYDAKKDRRRDGALTYKATGSNLVSRHSDCPTLLIEWLSEVFGQPPRSRQGLPRPNTLYMTKLDQLSDPLHGNVEPGSP